MPRSLIDWMAVLSLWIAAGILAIKFAGVPMLFASAVWGYLPFALVTVSGVIFLWRALRGSAVAPKAVAKDDSSASRQDPSRVFLDESITPEFLIYEAMRNGSRTAVNAYRGKWMRVSGPITEIDISDASERRLVLGSAQHDKSVAEQYINLAFSGTAEDKLRKLREGDWVSALGQLHGVLNDQTVALKNCEVEFGGKAHSPWDTFFSGRRDRR